MNIPDWDEYGLPQFTISSNRAQDDVYNETELFNGPYEVEVRTHDRSTYFDVSFYCNKDINEKLKDFFNEYVGAYSGFFKKTIEHEYGLNKQIMRVISGIPVANQIRRSLFRYSMTVEVIELSENGVDGDIPVYESVDKIFVPDYGHWYPMVDGLRTGSNNFVGVDIAKDTGIAYAANEELSGSYSMDCGYTWVKFKGELLGASEGDTLLGISTNGSGSKCYFYFEGGTVTSTSDFGRTFNVLTKPVSDAYEIKKLRVSNSGSTILALSTSGKIHKSTDGGLTWQDFDSSYFQGFPLDFDFSGDGSLVFISQDGGHVQYSSNGLSTLNLTSSNLAASDPDLISVNYTGDEFFCASNSGYASYSKFENSTWSSNQIQRYLARSDINLSASPPDITLIECSNGVAIFGFDDGYYSTFEADGGLIRHMPENMGINAGGGFEPSSISNGYGDNWIISSKGNIPILANSTYVSDVTIPIVNLTGEPQYEEDERLRDFKTLAIPLGTDPYGNTVSPASVASSREENSTVFICSSKGGVVYISDDGGRTYEFYSQGPGMSYSNDGGETFITPSPTQSVKCRIGMSKNGEAIYIGGTLFRCMTTNGASNLSWTLKNYEGYDQLISLNSIVGDISEDLVSFSQQGEVITFVYDRYSIGQISLSRIGSGTPIYKRLTPSYVGGDDIIGLVVSTRADKNIVLRESGKIIETTSNLDEHYEYNSHIDEYGISESKGKGLCISEDSNHQYVALTDYILYRGSFGSEWSLVSLTGVEELDIRNFEAISCDSKGKTVAILCTVGSSTYATVVYSRDYGQTWDYAEVSDGTDRLSLNVDVKFICDDYSFIAVNQYPTAFRISPEDDLPM